MDTDDATESTNLVDDLTLTIKEDAGEWEQSSNMMHGYKLLHETPGGVQLFVNTTMLLFENPSTLHKIATFVARMEKDLHRIISMTAVFTCLRANIGSDRTAAILANHLPQPGGLKTIIFKMSQCRKHLYHI